MLEFEYPKYLFLLLLVPALIGLFLYSRYRRRRSLRRYGKPEVLAHLMPDASRYMPAVKLTVECIAVALLALIMARPVALHTASSSQSSTETKVSGMEIMMCVDVSNSMLASSTDSPSGVSRLQRAKTLLERLIDRLGNDKIGLIAYAGNAALVYPITSDYVSARALLNSLNTNIISSQGTAIGQAIDMAVLGLENQNGFPKAIVLITDGENFEDDAAAAARNAAKQGIRVNVIGLGTEQGAPLPPINGYQMTDERGNPVITRLNVEEAKAIAEAGKGIYIDGNASNAVNALASNLAEMGAKDYVRTIHSPSDEQFPLLAWIVLALLIVDMLTPTHKISWLRRFTFFSKTTEKK